MVAPVRIPSILLLWIFMAYPAIAVHAEAESPAPGDHDQQVRERYEQVLRENPYQERAFDKAYEMYVTGGGIEAWMAKLNAEAQGHDAAGASALVVLARIHQRQFDTSQALACLEQAEARGEKNPQLQLLLGKLYYEAGEDDKALEALQASLETIQDEEKRNPLIRMLGHIYLRRGQPQEAIEAWRRIVEESTDNYYSLQELAEIYRDNRMWNEAIEVFRRIAAMPAADAYRRCRALQAVGQCYLHEENFPEAIAAFEQALDLVSPGHWLFEDLKTSLINVYQDMGGLAGFEKYLLAKREQTPSATEYRNLLAEVYIRLNQWDRAEQEYRAVLERDPRQPRVYENLIALYGRMKQSGKAVALFEKLIELYPMETDYLRRLGEFYQAQGQADLAKATWRRVVKADSPAQTYADLAGWFESYEYPAEAMAAYGEALARGKNKEWTFRLAALKFQAGQEEEGVRLGLSVLDPQTSPAKEYAEVAALLQAQNHPREAVDLLKTAVEKDPAALDIRLSYAKGLMQREQYDPALSQYQFLAGQSENEFLRETGEDGILDVYKAMGVLDEKQHAWETQLAAAPDSLELLKTLARVYSRTGHKEKAIPLYRRLAEREPENFEHLRVLARQYLQAKQYDEAIAAYRDLIRKDKTRLRAYSQDLLSIYLALDLKDEAVQAAEEITGAAPSDSETHLRLAQVYNTYGRTEDALREFRQTIRLKPEEKGYYEQYGEALAAAGRWGEAAEVCRKVMDLAETDDRRRAALRRLAVITLRQGGMDELIHDCEQRIYATPKRASAYLDLAAVCMEAGRPQRAIQVLEDGLNNVEDQTGLLRELIRSSYVYQDVQRVKRYHEQLLAATGRPSLQDYEMLGKVYLQTGDTQRALELWKKIAEENPTDARTLIKLAGLYEDSGFTGEALRVMGRAVELEPANCKQRIAYALALARDDRNTEAIGQLLALLEMGGTLAASPMEAWKARVLTRNTANLMEPADFLWNRRNPESFGMKTFADYQLEAVELMTEVAKNSVGIDYILKKYFARLQKNPQDTAALRDLTQIHITLENNPAAREANQTLRALLPNDLDVFITGARIEAMMYHFEEAAALLSRAMEIQPRQKKQFQLCQAYAYAEANQLPKAMEVIDALIGENPTDAPLILMAANVIRNSGDREVMKIYNQRIRENANPAVDRETLCRLAHDQQSFGEIEEAIAIYKDLLLTEPSLVAAVPKPATLYLPQMGNRDQGYNPKYYMLYRGLEYSPYWYAWDDPRIDALCRLNNLTEYFDSPKQLFEQMRKEFEVFLTNPGGTNAQIIYDKGMLLAAQRIVKKEYEEALNILNKIKEVQSLDLHWYNSALWACFNLDRYEEMDTLYQEVEKRFPAQRVPAHKGRILAALWNDDDAKTVALLQGLEDKQLPPSLLVEMVSLLVTIDKKDMAQAVLEKHLAGLNRPPAALFLLADLYLEKQKFVEALAMGQEAWQAKAHKRRGAFDYSVSSGWGYYSNMNRDETVDESLRKLHGYYVAAGKSQELIADFEIQRASQPDSLRLTEPLLRLYQLNGETDKAIALCEAFVAQKPNVLSLYKTLGDLYIEKQEYGKVKEMYKKLVETRPYLWEFQSALSNLYEQLGESNSQEYKEWLEKNVHSTTHIYTLYDQARDYERNEDINKVIETLERINQMQPGWVNLYDLGKWYMASGDYSKAFDCFKQYLNNENAYFDHSKINQLLHIYKDTGQLNIIKKIFENKINLSRNSFFPLKLKYLLALHENCIEETRELFDQLIDADRSVIQWIREDEQYLRCVKDIPSFYQKFAQREWLGQYIGPHDIPNYGDLCLIYGDKNTAMKFYDTGFDNISYILPALIRRLLIFGYTAEAESYFSKNFTMYYKKNRFSNIYRDFASLSKYVTLASVYNDSFQMLFVNLLLHDDKPDWNVKVVLEMLDLCKQVGQYREIDQIFRDLNQTYTTNPAISLKKAECEIEAGRPENSIPIYNHLLEKDSHNWTYRKLISKAWMNTGNPEKSIEVFQSQIESNPPPKLINSLADAQNDMGWMRTALENKRKALELADASQKLFYESELFSFTALNGEMLKDCGKLEQATHRAQSQERIRPFMGMNVHPAIPDLHVGHMNYIDYLAQNAQYDELHEQLKRNPANQPWSYYTLVDEYPSYIKYFITPDRLINYPDQRIRSEYYKNGLLLHEFQSLGKGRYLLEKQRRMRQFDRSPRPSQTLAYAINLFKMGYYQKSIELCDGMLLFNRWDYTANRIKANCLIKMGRIEDAKPMIRDIKGDLSFHDEIEAIEEYARFLIESGYPEESKKMMARILTWKDIPGIKSCIGDMYYAMHDYQKTILYFSEDTIDYYTNYLYSIYFRNDISTNFGKAFAKKGEYYKAVEEWKTELMQQAIIKSYYPSLWYDLNSWLRSLRQWLFEEKLFEPARMWIAYELEKQPANIEAYRPMATACLKTGHPDEAFQAFARGYQELPVSFHDSLSKEYAVFLIDQNLSLDALGRDFTRDTGLANGLAYAFHTMSEYQDQTRARGMADQMESIPLDNQKAMVKTAQGFENLGMTDQAAKWFQQASQCKSHDWATIRDTANGLSRTGRQNEALSLYVMLLSKNLRVIFNDSETVRHLFTLADESALPHVKEAIEQFTINDTQQKLYLTLLDYYQGSKDTALAELKALQPMTMMSAIQRRMMIQVFQESGNKNNARAVLQSIATQGNPVEHFRQASLDLVRDALDRQAYAESVPCYAELVRHSTDGLAVSAADLIFDVTDEAILNPLREAIASWISAATENDRCSDLAALYIELAEKFHHPEMIEPFLQKLPMDEYEQYEARIWPGLIETWEIAGPFSCPDMSVMNDEMPTDVALSQLTWKTTDPQSTRGFISVNRLYDGNDMELTRKCAYAKTQVHFTEDREQAFYVGSDDWVKVWVNGKEVFSNLEDRYGYPDQNRFLVKLHKGGNDILIRTGHGQGPWRFGLRLDNEPPGAFALETTSSVLPASQ